jgi:hypothetical protein
MQMEGQAVVGRLASQGSTMETTCHPAWDSIPDARQSVAEWLGCGVRVLLPAWAWMVALAACGAEPHADRVNVRMATLDGSATWSVEFDEDAVASGAEPCAYSRAYRAEEDRTVGWLCPTCEPVYRAEAVLDGAACHGIISDDPPDPAEWIGPGKGRWWRASGQNMLLSDQGEVLVDQDLSIYNETDWVDWPDGGKFRLVVDGSFQAGTTRGDPWHGLSPPSSYACGWLRIDLPEYEGNHRLKVGKVLPDGLFPDTCGEGVRLHDFGGRYLVIDISATDCGPCQVMADAEHAFLESMADGPAVEVVTLLSPALAEVISTPDRSMLLAWSDQFGLSSPVLGDRGWGYWLVNESLGSISYPAWIVVAPDLTVIEIGTGFRSWDDFRNIIVDHHAGR